MTRIGRIFADFFRFGAARMAFCLNGDLGDFGDGFDFYYII